MKKRVFYSLLIVCLMAASIFIFHSNDVQAQGGIMFKKETECIDWESGEVIGSAHDCIPGTKPCRDAACGSGWERWEIE